jgi:integration host factor subunit alpha
VALTKADLVEALYTKIGFSKKEAADLVEMVFETLKSTLASGSKVKISGFGNFVVRQKRARMGRNPQTGESIEISARKVLTFRPSQVLRAEVNSALGTPSTAAVLEKNDEDDEL